MSGTWEILEKGKMGIVQFTRAQRLPNNSSIITSGNTVDYTPFNDLGYTQGTLFFNIPTNGGTLTYRAEGSMDGTNYFTMETKTTTSTGFHFISWKTDTKYIRLSGSAAGGTVAVNTISILVEA